ncbi:MAG: hypothetical protein AAGI25_17295 [Bacteroidota bacterium]
MKISIVFIISALSFFIACSDKKTESNRGHSHHTKSSAHSHDDGRDHDGATHEHAYDLDSHHEQEEFIANEDSTETESDRYTHADSGTDYDQ